MRRMRKFRQQQTAIYYTDEMRVDVGPTKTRVWEGAAAAKSSYARRSELTTGKTKPER